MGKPGALPLGYIYWRAVLEFSVLDLSLAHFPFGKNTIFINVQMWTLTHGHQIASTVSANYTLNKFWTTSSSGRNQNGFIFLYWRGSQMSIWRQQGILHEAEVLNMPDQTQWIWWLRGQHDSQWFWNSPFFTDSISFGNLRAENIHSGSISSPQKAPWCQNCRQVAWRGEWTKISADGKHPSVV